MVVNDLDCLEIISEINSIVGGDSAGTSTKTFTAYEFSYANASGQ